MLVCPSFQLPSFSRSCLPAFSTAAAQGYPRSSRSSLACASSDLACRRRSSSRIESQRGMLLQINIDEAAAYALFSYCMLVSRRLVGTLGVFQSWGRFHTNFRAGLPLICANRKEAIAARKPSRSSKLSPSSTNPSHIVAVKSLLTNHWRSCPSNAEGGRLGLDTTWVSLPSTSSAPPCFYLTSTQP